MAGHAIATVIAVLGGSFLGKYLDEKVVQYVGGSLFLVSIRPGQNAGIKAGQRAGPKVLPSSQAPAARAALHAEDWCKKGLGSMRTRCLGWMPSSSHRSHAGATPHLLQVFAAASIYDIAVGAH